MAWVERELTHGRVAVDATGGAGLPWKPWLRQVESSCASCCGRVDIPYRVGEFGRVAGPAGSRDPAKRVPVCGAMWALLFSESIRVPLPAGVHRPNSSPRSCEGLPSSDEWAFAVSPLIKADSANGGSGNTHCVPVFFGN